MPDWWRQPSHRPSERFCTMLCALKCGDFGAPVPIGMGDGEPTCRRGSVHRSLAGVRMGDHPSVRPTWECLRADRPLPVWPCSGWGLPSRPGHPGRWCALTAPFHPHLCPMRAPGHRRSVLCGTVLRVAPTGCEPASCPVEPRPSSAWRTTPRSPGRLTVPASLARSRSGAQQACARPVRALALRRSCRR